MKADIAETIRAADMRPIENCWRSEKNDEAREMLRAAGTHYYDESTMKYFGCKVQSIGRSENGVYMWTIARQDRDAQKNKGYAVTFHDFGGWTLAERGDRKYFDTMAQAQAYRDAILAQLNEVEILVDVLRRHKETKEREARRAREAWNMLPRSVKVAKA